MRELPGVPGSVAGDADLCQGVTTKPYQVAPVSNTSSYEWSLPYGMNIINGAGSRYIVADFTADALGGNITVHGRNECGVGPESAPLAITVNSRPATNAGFDQNVCSSSADECK